jgi:hypothetical protein
VKTPTAAFVTSLIAGILILISGVMYFVMGATFSNRAMGWYYQGMQGMMGGYFGGMMGGYPGSTGFISSFIVFFGAIGVICGIIIIVGASMLNSRPASHGTWGIVILVLSVVSLFAGGGFVAGAILGIIGGILAITWKPAELTSSEKKSS